MARRCASLNRPAVHRAETDQARALPPGGSAPARSRVPAPREPPIREARPFPRHCASRASSGRRRELPTARRCLRGDSTPRRGTSCLRGSTAGRRITYSITKSSVSRGSIPRRTATGQSRKASRADRPRPGFASGNTARSRNGDAGRFGPRARLPTRRNTAPSSRETRCSPGGSGPARPMRTPTRDPRSPCRR